MPDARSKIRPGRPAPAATPGVIMAGGKDSEAFSRAGEDPRPGMALIHGRPMVGYVVDALRQANGIAPLLAVVRPDMPDVAGVDRRVDAAGDMVANVGA